MKRYRQTPGRDRQKALFVAKGIIAGSGSQLKGLIYGPWGTYLTDSTKRDLNSALAYVNKAFHSFNKEVGWPCKDDKA